MPANSRRVASTAFFMRSSASARILFVVISSRLLHDRSDGLALHDTEQVAPHADVEHDQRQAIVHAQGDRRRVHDLYTAIQDMEIIEGRTAAGGGVHDR